MQHSDWHTLATAILGIFLGGNMESYYYGEPVYSLTDGL